MLTLALLVATPAQAGDIVVITANRYSRDLTDYSELEEEEEEEEATEEEEEGDEPEEEEPETAVVTSSHGGSQLRARYAMHFLPDAPAHYVGLRHSGEKDSYLNVELRYLPASDLMWTGRAGAGFDLLGDGNWDLTAGLFIGTNGEWERSDEARILYSAPMGGAELGLGVESERLFAKYRWLWGLGSGPLDDALTENELTVGYKLNPTLHLFGQWIRVNPGEAEASGGIGLGVQAVF